VFSGGVTLKRAGSQSITATDTVTGTITGSQTGITVNAGVPAKMLFVNCSDPANNATCSGQPISLGNNGSMTFQVELEDTYGNPAAPTSTVSITFSDSDGTFSITSGSPATIASPATTSATVTLHHGVNGGTDTLTATDGSGQVPPITLTAQK
jgi:hypothetical protein